MAEHLRSALDRELIPALMQRNGVTSAFMLRSDRAPEMTAEQRIRGVDASVDLVIFVTGYSSEAITTLATAELGEVALGSRGASPGIATNTYELACIAGGAA